MDNLTHTLIGVGLAKAGLSKKFGPGTTAILMVSSNLPDIDVAFLFGGPLTFLWRRTPTHSLLGSIVLAILAAWLCRKIFPSMSWWKALGLTALGIGAHVFADLWNSYGVVLFWPFSWTRVDLSWVFIIDLVLWGVLFSSLALGRLFVRFDSHVWRVGLAIVVIYIGVCSWARQSSADLLNHAISHNRESKGRSFLYPEPFGPQQFRGVVHNEEDYNVFRIFPFERRIEWKESIEVQQPSDIVSQARASVAGRRLDWFFSTPVWRLSANGQSAVVYGLGFRSELLTSRFPFVFEVSADGSVKRVQKENY